MTTHIECSEAEKRSFATPVTADAEDAARWRYTQQKGYFFIRPDADVDNNFSVGVLKHKEDPRAHYSDYKTQLGLNECIEGRGATLAEAIDNALSKRS